MVKPNWKNNEDYDYTDGLDRPGWAWEFLRRNPEYKEDWLKFLDIKKQLIEEYGPLDKEGHGPFDLENFIKLGNDPRYTIKEPPAQPLTGIEEWPVLYAKDQKMRFDTWLAWHWGLQGMIDPGTVPSVIPWQGHFDHQPTILFTEEKSEATILKGRPHNIDSEDRMVRSDVVIKKLKEKDPKKILREWLSEETAGPIITLPFDLRSSIHNQILVAEQKLKNWQKKAIDEGRIGSPKAAKKQVFEWRRYLRILDGREYCRENGMTIAKMYSIVFQGINCSDYEDTVKKNTRKAIANMKYGYLKILFPSQR